MPMITYKRTSGWWLALCLVTHTLFWFRELQMGVAPLSERRFSLSLCWCVWGIFSKASPAAMSHQQQQQAKHKLVEQKISHLFGT